MFESIFKITNKTKKEVPIPQKPDSPQGFPLATALELSVLIAHGHRLYARAFAICNDR